MHSPLEGEELVCPREKVSRHDNTEYQHKTKSCLNGNVFFVFFCRKWRMSRIDGDEHAFGEGGVQLVPNFCLFESTSPCQIHIRLCPLCPSGHVVDIERWMEKTGGRKEGGRESELYKSSLMHPTISWTMDHGPWAIL